jgi:uncharacterized membrane protein YebE (DUF533 family)
MIMEMSHSDQRELTAEEKQELEKLRKIIEQASADGVITKGERDRITAAMQADGKVTYEELNLTRSLIHEKVAKGELAFDYQ